MKWKKYCTMIKGVKYWCSGFFFFYIMCATCYIKYWWKGNLKCSKETRTGHDVINWVRSVHAGAGYTALPVRHHILISRKLWYPATPFTRTCRIKLILLHLRSLDIDGRIILTLPFHLWPGFPIMFPIQYLECMLGVSV